MYTFASIFTFWSIRSRIAICRRDDKSVGRCLKKDMFEFRVVKMNIRSFADCQCFVSTRESKKPAPVVSELLTKRRPWDEARPPFVSPNRPRFFYTFSATWRSRSGFTAVSPRLLPDNVPEIYSNAFRTPKLSHRPYFRKKTSRYNFLRVCTNDTANLNSVLLLLYSKMFNFDEPKLDSSFKRCLCNTGRYGIIVLQNVILFRQVYRQIIRQGTVHKQIAFISSDNWIWKI